MSDLLFDAHLALRAASRGGRRRAIADGYRGSVFWGDVDAGGAPRTNDVILRLAEPLEPGAEGAVTIVPFVAEYWTEKARGDRFSLLEGARGRCRTHHDGAPRR